MASPTANTVPAPLGAALGFTFLNSVGTGVVTNGLYFLTKHAFGFSEQLNYVVAVVLGVVYVAAALGVGPVLARAMLRSNRITPRLVLVCSMLILGAVCWLPFAADRLGLGDGAWIIWTLVFVYAPTTGVLWPIVESYVSGGRRGHTLRAAVGRFNISWAVAIVAAFWLMGPFVESRAVETIAALGVVHIAAIALLIPMGAHPGKHLADLHEPHPPVYRDLLATFRLLLPGSYVMLAALSPFVPEACERIGLGTSWHTPAVATWMLSRTLVFVVLERWHGWHGKWSAAIVGVGALLAGFVVTVLAPRAGLATEPAAALLIGGLAVFGIGLGIIYFAALYYALEVGQAEVAAGGLHEALIGIGYTLGPLSMLLASLAVSTGLVGPQGFEPVVFGLMGLIVACVAAGVGRNIRKLRRVGEPSDPLGRT
jgi:hypothetical protein